MCCNCEKLVKYNSLKKDPDDYSSESFYFQCGRWGEVEIEKGPVDLFPTEPTDEDRQVEETLNPGFKELLGLTTKKEQVI